MPSGAAPLVQKFEAEMGAVAVGADFSQVIRVPYAGTVTSVTYAPIAAVTGAATNSRTLNVINKGQDGTGTTVVASLALVSGIDMVAFDEKTITLSVVANATTVAAGDILQVQSLHV